MTSSKILNFSSGERNSEVSDNGPIIGPERHVMSLNTLKVLAQGDVNNIEPITSSERHVIAMQHLLKNGLS